MGSKWAGIVRKQLGSSHENHAKEPFGLSHRWNIPGEISLRRLQFRPQPPYYGSLKRDALTSPFHNGGRNHDEAEECSLTEGKDWRSKEAEKGSTKGQHFEYGDPFKEGDAKETSTLRICKILKRNTQSHKASVFLVDWDGSKFVAKFFDWFNPAYDDMSFLDSDEACGNEAHAYYRLRGHPQYDRHFVKFHGMFEARAQKEDGTSRYFAVLMLDYFDGIALKDIHTPKEVSLEIRVTIIGKVVCAVRAAEERNVTHDSVYGRNVLVGKEELDVKLIDFGNWTSAQPGIMQLRPYAWAAHQVEDTKPISMSVYEYEIAKLGDRLKEWMDDISLIDLFAMAKKAEGGSALSE